MPIVYYVASLRFGGEKKTYGDHVLVVGDAAGMHIQMVLCSKKLSNQL